MTKIKKLYKKTRYKIEANSFLFSELVKRDFVKKYKGTALGMVWSMLSPLLQLLVMRVVFVNFFGRTTPHYTIYLFSGNIVMSYFKESTKHGMRSLYTNASIFSKIKVPKYLFLLSQNVSALINFMLTIVIYFVFVAFDHIAFTPKFLMLLFPIVCLCVFNIGVGMILSALYVFFRDTSYIYDIVLTLVTYVSAVFYTIDRFDQSVQNLFLLNPIFVYIKYFRTIVIDNVVPSLAYHGLCMLYALIAIVIGSVIYKTQNNKFLYYV